MLKRILIILIISPLIIIFDQATKWYILKNLSFQEDFFVIDRILSLSPFKNTGVAFGLPLPQFIFYILSFVIIVLLFWIYFKYLIEKRKWYLDIAMGFIIGGAISNVIDRIRLDHVLDFIDFQIWPVFNAADVFIVIGVGILVVKILISDKDKSKISNF